MLPRVQLGRIGHGCPLWTDQSTLGSEKSTPAQGPLIVILLIQISWVRTGRPRETVDYLSVSLRQINGLMPLRTYRLRDIADMPILFFSFSWPTCTGWLSISTAEKRQSMVANSPRSAQEQALLKLLGHIVQIWHYMFSVSRQRHSRLIPFLAPSVWTT